MKNCIKKTLILLLAAAMSALPAVAAPADGARAVVVSEDASVEVVEAVEEEAVVAEPIPVVLPTSLKFAPAAITSSMFYGEEEDRAMDVSPLYDLDAATAITFEEGFSLGATCADKFRLANVLVNKTDVKASYTIEGSVDGIEWKQLNVKVLDKDNGFLEIDVIALARAYKFYRVTAVADEALELHTLSFMWETAESKYTPFSLWATGSTSVYPVYDLAK